MKFYIKLLSIFCIVLLSATACKDKASSGFSTSASGAATENYTSKMTKADKKKYFDASNNVVFEVKYKADGFKLRTPASKLLWKIKLYDTKVKISDNEENLNPYEIKIVNDHEAKLVKDDVKLARLVFDAAAKTQTITASGNTPEVLNGNFLPSILVNKIPEISSNQKKIIINELQLKGF